MELWQELIRRNEAMIIEHLGENSIYKLLECECYKALQKIKAILENEALSDEECFYKIEEIVCVFEELGSDGGSRHDF